MLAQLSELIDGTDTLKATKRAELRGVISTKPGLNRYLRVTAGGLLRGCYASTKPRPRPRPAWTPSTCCAAPTSGIQPGFHYEDQ